MRQRMPSISRLLRCDFFDERVGDLTVDMFDGVAHTFAVVAIWISVTQLNSLVRTGGGA